MSNMPEADRRFDLGRARRCETGRTTPWSARLRAGLTALAMIAAAPPAGAHAPAHHMHRQAPAIAPTQRFVFRPKDYDPKTRTWSALDFDRAATKLQRRIENATVLLLIVNNSWTEIGAGSGTLLSNQKIGGNPAIASITHVTGWQKEDRAHHMRMIVVDHDGDILGVARPMQVRQPADTPGVGADQPTLLAFDTRYPLNRMGLARIQGVELAPRLPRGYLFGKISGPVGIDAGASGGGWYDEYGQLIGVTHAPAARCAGVRQVRRVLEGIAHVADDPIKDLIPVGTDRFAGIRQIAPEGGLTVPISPRQDRVIDQGATDTPPGPGQ